MNKPVTKYDLKQEEKTLFEGKPFSGECVTYQERIEKI
jgi:hypothetical protein